MIHLGIHLNFKTSYVDIKLSLELVNMRFVRHFKTSYVDIKLTIAIVCEVFMKNFKTSYVDIKLLKDNRPDVGEGFQNIIC